jgi:hypothetical protein
VVECLPSKYKALSLNPSTAIKSPYKVPGYSEGIKKNALKRWPIKFFFGNPNWKFRVNLAVRSREKAEMQHILSS